MGTVALLEWARAGRPVERFIYVSSGSVYRHHGPDWSGEPLPEDGYVAPVTLYGISKFASEMIVNRYADLFGLSAASVPAGLDLWADGPGDREPQFPPCAQSRRPYGAGRRSDPAQQPGAGRRLPAFGRMPPGQSSRC